MFILFLYILQVCLDAPELSMRRCVFLIAVFGLNPFSPLMLCPFMQDLDWKDNHPGGGVF